MSSSASRLLRFDVGELLVGGLAMLVLGAGVGVVAVDATGSVRVGGTAQPPAPAGTPDPVGSAVAPVPASPASSASPTPSAQRAVDVPTPLPQPVRSAPPSPGPVGKSTAAPAPSAAAGFQVLRSASFTDGVRPGGGCSESVSRGASVDREEQNYDGGPAARARTPDGPGTAYARTVCGDTAGEPQALELGEGEDFTYGMALYLPTGFHEAMQGYFSPMRWDNFGAEGVSRSGLAMYRDGTIRLFRERVDVESQTNLLPGTTFRLTEGAWHWIEVRQRLSAQDGSARNELHVDGALVGSSSLRNYYGDPVSAVRFGIVATDSEQQARPLSVLYDRVLVGRGHLGARR